MTKTEAITQLGGTITSAAKLVGVSYHAVHKWPEVLTSKIEDRVTAALSRQKQMRKITK